VIRTTQNNPFVDIPSVQRQLMVACVVLYALLVVLLSITIPGATADRIIVLVSSLFFLGVLSLPIFYAFKGDGYLQPLVLTSSFVMLHTVLGQTDVLATGLDYHVGLKGWSQRDLSLLVAYVNIVASVSFLAKYAGYNIAGTASISSIQFKNRPNNLFLPLLCVWGALGALAMFIIVQASGGIEAHLTNMNRGHSTKVFVANQRLIGGAAFVVQSTVVIPILYALFRKNGHRTLTFFMLVLASAAIAYLAAGRRSAIVNPAFFAIAIWIYKERNLPLLRAIVAGLGLFFFVAIGGIWRESNRRLGGGVNWDFLQGMTVGTLAERSMQELSSRAGSSDAIYAIAARVPGDVPFTYGLNYFENFYRFIPRAVWPEKPRGIGIQCAETFFNRFEQGGVPPGPLGEAYWSFHVPGVILIFFLFGIFLRMLANTYARYPNAVGMVVVYILTLMRLSPDQISFRIWIFTLIPTLAFLVATSLLVPRR